MAAPDTHTYRPPPPRRLKAIERELYTCCYSPAKPFPALRREVVSSLKATGSLCKALQLGKPHIHYSDDLDGCACYCAGSYADPVIVIAPNAYDDPDLDLRRGVYSTIVHELIHAYLETLGLDCGSYEHPEDEVESLTRRYCDGLLDAGEVAEALDKLADTLM